MGEAFPLHDHAARRDRVRERLAELDVDLLYVTGSANVAYLTGFTGSNGQLLVACDPAGDALLTDPRYVGRAATEAPDVDAVITRTPVDVATDRAHGRLGFEGTHVTWHQGQQLVDALAERGGSAVATADVVEGLRVVKDVSEVARIREACRITTDAFADLLDDLRPGRTERDLAVQLERRFVDLGADVLAFPSIVASGPNGAIPHHEPTDRTLERGDLVTFDVGALVDGYHADFTRTVAVGGPPRGEWEELHALVAAAQRTGVDAAVADATCEEVDEAARAVLREAGREDAFVHGIGHGLGLQIHEAPIVTASPTARLAASTVLTVEPGVYLPDVPVPGGVRIEDTIVVTADGPPEHLTVAQHALLTVPG